MIKIDFTKTHETHGTFSDAILLDENHTLSEEEIEIMKQQRFDNWLTSITSATKIITPVDIETVDKEI